MLALHHREYDLADHAARDVVGLEQGRLGAGAGLQAGLPPHYLLHGLEEGVQPGGLLGRRVCVQLDALVLVAQVERVGRLEVIALDDLQVLDEEPGAQPVQRPRYKPQRAQQQDIAKLKSKPSFYIYVRSSAIAHESYAGYFRISCKAHDTSRTIYSGNKLLYALSFADFEKLHLGSVKSCEKCGRMLL